MDKACRDTQRPFAFRVSREDIIRFSESSAEQRLTWLQEARDFVQSALSQQDIERWYHLIKAQDIAP